MNVTIIGAGNVGANHTFDFLWGGWGSQITRYSLEVFLESNLKPPGEEAKIPGSFEHQFKGQRHKGGHSEKRELLKHLM